LQLITTAWKQLAISITALEESAIALHVEQMPAVCSSTMTPCTIAPRDGLLKLFESAVLRTPASKVSPTDTVSEVYFGIVGPTNVWQMHLLP
jgi:hypothetical protein